jgi:flagellar hook-associated protein FlgK
MSDAILVGLSGLQTHQRAIEVTSHNIANAATPGYTRQRADLVTQIPGQQAVGQIGRGVTVEGIRRLANDLIIERIRLAHSETSRLETMQQTLKAAESLFNEPGDNGISAAINKLFAGFEDLANNPESTALRASVVAELDSFTFTLNNLGNRLNSLRDSMRGTLESSVVEVNRLTTEIRQLNQSIRDQTLSGNNPNDLLDRREGLINDLSKLMNLRVRTMPTDGTVLIEASGVLMVGLDYNEQLSIGNQSDGSLTLLASNRSAISAGGGELGALFDLQNTVLPGIIEQMDTVAASLAVEFNARQATGTNHAFPATLFLSEQAIDENLSAVDLDHVSQTKSASGVPGIPELYLPKFTDDNGNVEAKNLTINVYDPVAKTAQKYTLRYDPASGGGGRSLDDIVSAINTGRSTQSGGFTLYPPSAGGIAGVTARKIPVDGGYRLEIAAASGKRLDFSQALDVVPTANVWTSGATSVTGSDVNLAGKRLTFTVVGNTLQASYRDAQTGGTQNYASPLVLGGVSGTIGSLNLNLTAGASNYHAGEQFSVDFDSSGNVVTSTATHNPSWTAGDATLKISGRYTGEQSFVPGQNWSMRVLSSGTIGSATAAPIVEFNYYTGPKNGAALQTKQVVLDDQFSAGSPVQIADGVYAVFSAGSLSTVGNHVDFVVDGDPDQARLLPALGINTMFSGSTAATLSVNQSIKNNPNMLGIAQSRSEGDNAQLLSMSDVRQGQIFGGGRMGVDDYYHATITDLGVRLADTKRLSDNQAIMAKALENQRQESSGVSIDEEVANLILMQQAYTAAARVITTARENIQTLMELMR